MRTVAQSVAHAQALVRRYTADNPNSCVQAFLAPRRERRVSEIVLNASALLAMLKEEPGGATVADAIAATRMSAVNYAEVVGHFVHAGIADKMDGKIVVIR